MEEKKKELLEKLSECVVEMEDEEIVELAKEYIEHGYSANDGIMEGLVDGMNKAGQLYEEEEYYIAELLLCSDAMYAGINVLKDYLDDEDNSSIKNKIVIGVIEGDTHDIGKNLVKIMLETAGFEIIDLGRDVQVGKFVDVAREEDADIICLSSLMTSTMGKMEDVIEILKKEGLRDKVKVMIGGGPITEDFAEKIGADAYSKTAVEAVKVAKDLLNM